MTKLELPRLVPRLVVKGAARAIDFYKNAFGAAELARFADPNLDDLIVHAELSIAGATFTLTEESTAYGNVSPSSLDGTPVILHLDVQDADAVGERMTGAGAEVVIPIADQFYGAREGRLRDPFGHLWIISQRIAELSAEEIQRRVDAFPHGG